MKIEKINANNHKKAFEVLAGGKEYLFPYAQLEVRPSPPNGIKTVYIDEELGSEGFTYLLESGDEGTVHIDHVLEYNRDPRYLRDLLLYNLTLTAQEGVANSPLSKRELIRRLDTSPAQFYRLLDQTNYKKTIDQLMTLLHILDYEVEIVVKKKPPHLSEAV
jgi:hypothetical protein